MERREFLKALIGCAAGVAGAAMLAAGSAEAIPLAPAPVEPAKPGVKPEPAIITQSEVDGMKAEPVWHRRWHRRRHVYRRRHWRRRHWRHRYW